MAAKEEGGRNTGWKAWELASMSARSISRIKAAEETQAGKPVLRAATPAGKADGHGNCLDSRGELSHNHGVRNQVGFEKSRCENWKMMTLRNEHDFCEALQGLGSGERLLLGVLKLKNSLVP